MNADIAPALLERAPELELLDMLNLRSKPRVGIVAGGSGMGKSALVEAWLSRQQEETRIVTGLTGVRRGRSSTALDGVRAILAHLLYAERPPLAFGSKTRLNWSVPLDARIVGLRAYIELLMQDGVSGCLPLPGAADVALLKEDPKYNADVLELVEPRKRNWAPDPDVGNNVKLLTSVLQRIAEICPITIVLDDLQWIDQPSLACIERSMLSLSDQNVTLITTLTTTPGGTSRSTLSSYLSGLTKVHDAVEVNLDAIDKQRRRDYCVARLRRADLVYGGAEADEMLVLTDGNPQLVENVLRQMRVGDFRRVSEATRKAELSPLSPVGREDFDSMEKEDRRVIEYASVAGFEFPAEVISRALEMPLITVLEVIDKRREMFLEFDEDSTDSLSWFRFVHGLSRRFVLESLISAARRREIHRMILAAWMGLSQDGQQRAKHLHSIAHHAIEALSSEAWLRCLEASELDYANSNFYGVVDVVEAAALALRNRADPHHATAAAHCMLLAARSARTVGDFGKQGVFADIGLEYLSADEDELRAEFLTEKISSLYNMDDMDLIDPLIQEATKIVANESVSDGRRSHVLRQTAISLERRGKPAEALAILANNTRMPQEGPPLADSLSTAAMCAWALGHQTPAEALAIASLQIGVRDQYTSRLTLLLTRAAQILRWGATDNGTLEVLVSSSCQLAERQAKPGALASASALEVSLAIREGRSDIRALTDQAQERVLRLGGDIVSSDPLQVIASLADIPEQGVEPVRELLTQPRLPASRGVFGTADIYNPATLWCMLHVIDPSLQIPEIVHERLAIYGKQSFVFAWLLSAFSMHRENLLDAEMLWVESLVSSKPAANASSWVAPPLDEPALAFVERHRQASSDVELLDLAEQARRLGGLRS